MNILVINVSLRPTSPIKLFPIGLGFITTAMTKAGYAFTLLDIDANRYSMEEVEARLKKTPFDVVLTGCIVTGYSKVKTLASLIKKVNKDALIISGNSVATSVPEILLTRTDVDILVMGEGDETIIDLLGTIEGRRPLEDVSGIYFLKNGAIVKNTPRPKIKNISTLPFIDYEPYDVEIYIENSKSEVSDPLPFPREQVRALPVNTARGCIAKCTFCYHVFKDYGYRFRTAESITDEIESLVKKFNLNYIHFWDELTFFSKKQALKLVDAILDRKLDVIWTAQCRANLFTDDEDAAIVKKMKQAGCIGMQYSLESSDTTILKEMNKNISIGQFSSQTKLYQDNGIATWTSLVIGYPMETPETIRDTFACCIANNIYPSVGYLLPQPGSVMYDYAKANGYIGDDDEEYLLKMGDRQDLRINMTKMSDDVLTYEVESGLQQCNEKLKMGLKFDELIKTQYFRAKEVSEEK